MRESVEERTEGEPSIPPSASYTVEVERKFDSLADQMSKDKAARLELTSVLELLEELESNLGDCCERRVDFGHLRGRNGHKKTVCWLSVISSKEKKGRGTRAERTSRKVRSSD